MKKLLLASIAVSALVLWAVSCGGGGGGGGTNTPTGPSTNTPPAATAVNIVGSAGSGAFTPNPVQVPSGGTIQWRNSTTDPHVLVMNDGRPIGTLSPGGTITTTIGAGGNFHCTTHPTMVGSINGATVPPPPQETGDGYVYVTPAVAQE